MCTRFLEYGRANTVWKMLDDGYFAPNSADHSIFIHPRSQDQANTNRNLSTTTVPISKKYRVFAKLNVNCMRELQNHWKGLENVKTTDGFLVNERLRFGGSE